MTEQTTETQSITQSGPLTDIKLKLTGSNGNAFAILGKVAKALKRGGQSDLVKPFMDEAMSGDYDHLLQTCMKYVKVT